jgi:CubicO group peptidase (beta-lactamase class C family)
MFTAVTVADAVGRGLAGFHTPVVDILAAERRPATLRPDVTVHHLLTHTSGIADYAEEDEDHPAHLEDYATLWAARPCYRMCQPADFLPLFGDLPPYRPPGQQFQYSNAGYIVLGLIAEQLTGLPFADAVTAAVFSPAGMTGSGFFALDEVHPDIATGYLRPVGPGEPWRTNIYSIPVIGGADGGAFATAADLDRFLLAYDDGTLTGPLRDTMLHPYHPLGEGDLTTGYGVFLSGTGRSRRWGHGGGDPGCGVLVHRLSELDTNVIALCNVNDVVSDVRDQLVDAALAL